jgi:hypothetical protein
MLLWFFDLRKAKTTENLKNIMKKTSFFAIDSCCYAAWCKTHKQGGCSAGIPRMEENFLLIHHFTPA